MAQGGEHTACQEARSVTRWWEAGCLWRAILEDALTTWQGNWGPQSHLSADTCQQVPAAQHVQSGGRVEAGEATNTHPSGHSPFVQADGRKVYNRSDWLES